MAGEANDLVSAYTQVQMFAAPSHPSLPPLPRPLQVIALASVKNARPREWIKPPPNRRPKQWDAIGETVGPPKRNRYGLPLAGQLWGRRLEEVLLKHKFGRKGTNAEEFCEKNSIWRNRPLLLIQLYVGCTQRQAEIDHHAVQAEADGSYESPPQSDPDDVDEMHEKLTKQVRIQQSVDDEPRGRDRNHELKLRAVGL